MTGPDDPCDLTGRWPDVLAAYADGELDPCARAAVARWLASHPHSAAELLAQQQLSPENWRLWQHAEPPLPTEDTWATILDAVAVAATAPATPAAKREANWWRRTGAYFAGGVAAAVAVVGFVAVGAVFFPQHREPLVYLETVAPADPLAGHDVLAVATEADVDVHRVVGGGAGWLPVGGPLPGALVLATEDDVDVDEAEPHPAWPTGGPRTTTAPGDAPMIYAANRR